MDTYILLQDRHLAKPCRPRLDPRLAIGLIGTVIAAACAVAPTGPQRSVPAPQAAAMAAAVPA